MRIVTKGRDKGDLISREIDLGYGDNRFTHVFLKGCTFYAAGYGLVSPDQNQAFVRVYKCGNLGSYYKHDTTAGFDKGLKTTGLAVGKYGVYLAGYGEYTTFPQTCWVVKAYDLNLTHTWQRIAVRLNDGQFDKAMDIAVGAKAVIAVGQVQDGREGPNMAGVEAYTP